MLRQIVTSTLRGLGRRPGFAAITIGGLAVAVGAAVLMLVFSLSELSYDRHFEDHDRTYRVWVKEDWGPDQQFFNATTPVRVGPTVLANVPAVENWTRFDPKGGYLERGARRELADFRMVDPGFFNIFPHDVLEGPAPPVMRGPHDIVITERARADWFGESPGLGETLTLTLADSAMTVTVAGVVETPRRTSSIQFDMLLSYDLAPLVYPERILTAWFNVSPETYAQLRPGAHTESAETGMAQIIQREEVGGEREVEFTLGLQPLTDIHLNTDVPRGLASVADPVYVYLLLGIAGLLLAVASINHVTLSLSRLFSRAREIGVRKATGATRSQLLGHFWGESMLVTLFAVLAGFAVAHLLAPVFNELTGQVVDIGLSTLTLGVGAGLFLLLSVAGGLYPAALLSRLSAVSSLRGEVGREASSHTARRALVMVQFALAMILISGTVIVRSQLQYMEQKDLGFDARQVMYVNTNQGWTATQALAERLGSELEGRSGIERVAAATTLFGERGWGRAGYTANDGSYRRFHANLVDADFVPALGLTVTEGRAFTPADTLRGFMVNEALVEAYGWTDPLSETLPGPWDEHEIVGVVRDFHYAPLHESIQPAVMAINSRLLSSGISDFDGGFRPSIIVPLVGSDVDATIAAIGDVWKRVAPDIAYNPQFVDDDLAAQYRQERRTADVASIGALLAVLIGAMGLVGLAATVVARRTKEIGIRRVLGASATSVVSLFVRDFALLVGIAFALSAPVAWITGSRWLDSFAYRTDLGPAPFLAAAGIILIVVIATVSLQALRAVRAQPVKALRSE